MACGTASQVCLGEEEGNDMTEYEALFSTVGNRIDVVVAYE
jgi:hypothetical protein